MPIQISDWNDLDDIRNDLSGDYELVNDLDENTDGYVGLGDDWTPLGVNAEDMFSGTFDGNGYEIADLICPNSYGGLFRSLDSATVKDLSLVDIDFDVSDSAGAVVYWSENSSFENIYASGTIDVGSAWTGGVVGIIEDGSIVDTVADVDVTSTASATSFGGLVGRLDADSTAQRCMAMGDVQSSHNFTGGLIGYTRETDGQMPTVYECASFGSVTSTGNRAGGLIGGGEVDECKDCYAHGSVEGADSGDRVSGFIGGLSAGVVENCYSAAPSIVNTGSGGENGFTTSGGTVTDCYFDEEASGISSGEGTALNTAEMQGDAAKTNLSGFDFADTWETVDGDDSDSTGDGYAVLVSLDRQSQLEVQGLYTIADGEIAGIVTLDGSGVEDTDVVIIDREADTLEDVVATTSSGEYSITVQDGSYHVYATDDGYTSRPRPAVDVTADETTGDIDFSLQDYTPPDQDDISFSLSLKQFRTMSASAGPSTASAGLGTLSFVRSPRAYTNRAAFGTGGRAAYERDAASLAGQMGTSVDREVALIRSVSNTVSSSAMGAERVADYIRPLSVHSNELGVSFAGSFTVLRTMNVSAGASSLSTGRTATYHRGGQASALAFDGGESLSLPVDDDPTSISIWVRDHGDWEIVVEGETATEPMKARDTVIRRGGEATTSRQNESDTVSGGVADTIFHLVEIGDTQYVDNEESPFPRRFWMVDGGTLDAPRWGSSLGKSVVVDDIRTYDRELTT